MIDIISSLISIAAYILLALGMYSIAKRRGIKNPWLAWIPVANMWLLGCISDQYRYVAKGQEKSKRKMMLVLSILNTLVALILVVALLVWVFGLMSQMGILDMSEAELNQLLEMDDDLFAEQFANEVIEILENNPGQLVGLMLGVMGGGLISGILGIWLLVLEYMALYDLFASANPSNAGAYVALSIFLGNFLQGLLVFLSRDKDEGMPPRQEQVVEQPVWQPPVNTSPEL